MFEKSDYGTLNCMHFINAIFERYVFPKGANFKGYVPNIEVIRKRDINCSKF